jgi:hypothetical protein
LRLAHVADLASSGGSLAVSYAQQLCPDQDS